ncbi:MULTISPECIES: PaaI family thioesterase [Flavobacterium]|uniref:PaaI family thioesterase n=2 Tax=Flavobacterium TaxID=237 RepID=A0AA94JPE3_9FLAO|nr:MULTISPECIES: PaaI family thioesterase [Flavobacterium]OXA74765.1 thioesterase [Flavobacterium columnare] [Flavobacterium columnare NBRC 100251 = ATCC 23463]AMA48947.1 thioesterase [Flavobacterium covae]AND64922.1 thioesterase [Flavobacterium covae]MCH4830918.1 PaaI family thioesterase [Flavobacterium columnare]MCH4833141.1 PaaI family thioesterase [Flavobacterium columnare]
MIFDKEKFVEKCNVLCQNTLMETLKIKFIEAGNDYLIAKMPVESSVHQPMGLLHGGATVALAESVGSAASLMFINLEKQEIRGIEISANHLKSKRTGEVTAIAKLVHKGRSLHLWEIRIEDENKSLISLCKLTNIVLPKREL